MYARGGTMHRRALSRDMFLRGKSLAVTMWNCAGK